MCIRGVPTDTVSFRHNAAIDERGPADDQQAAALAGHDHVTLADISSEALGCRVTHVSGCRSSSAAPLWPKTHTSKFPQQTSNHIKVFNSFSPMAG